MAELKRIAESQLRDAGFSRGDSKLCASICARIMLGADPHTSSDAPSAAAPIEDNSPCQTQTNF